MPDYDLERSQRERAEVTKTFAELFPLAPKESLPWAICHIAGFLRGRILYETQEATFHFTSDIVKILCEVSPPKTHVVDMARNVVSTVFELRNTVSRLSDEINRLKQEAARRPTHRCKVCGALWTLWPENKGWSLYSKTCGKCCDNVTMGEQIEELK